MKSTEVVVYWKMDFLTFERHTLKHPIAPFPEPILTWELVSVFSPNSEKLEYGSIGNLCFRNVPTFNPITLSSYSTEKVLKQPKKFVLGNYLLTTWSEDLLRSNAFWRLYFLLCCCFVLFWFCTEIQLQQWWAPMALLTLQAFTASDGFFWMTIQIYSRTQPISDTNTSWQQGWADLAVSVAVGIKDVTFVFVPTLTFSCMF